MALKGVSAPAVAAAGIGGLFLWSGLKGAKISTTARSLLSGQQPSGANANPISGASYASQFDIGIPGGTASLGSGNGAGIAQDAMKYQGHMYQYGGFQADPRGWDCSSFANWVVGHDMGLAIPGWGAGKYNGTSHGPPTGAWLLWGGVKGIPRNSVQAGDIMVWQTHMGIAINNSQMISATGPSGTPSTVVGNIDGGGPGGEILFPKRLLAVG
jgi:cell wall-associated NlpC family hydrolase